MRLVFLVALSQVRPGQAATPTASQPDNQPANLPCASVKTMVTSYSWTGCSCNLFSFFLFLSFVGPRFYFSQLRFLVISLPVGFFNIHAWVLKARVECLACRSSNKAVTCSLSACLCPSLSVYLSGSHLPVASFYFERAPVSTGPLTL